MVPAYANLPLHVVLGTLNQLGFWAQLAMSVALLSFGMVMGIALTLYRIQNSRSPDQPETWRRPVDGVIWLAGYRQNSASRRTHSKNK